MPLVNALKPPDGIRPGQLGVVLLGHVIIGDVAATLVDLSIRRLLRVDEQEGTDPGWLLTPLHTRAPEHRLETLLRYERVLLDAVSHDGARVRMSSLTNRMPKALDHTRAAVVHDAVHRGWLRHLHHDQRTEAGEQLVRRIRSFRRGLRQLEAERGEDALTGPLLPYAMHFGMIRGSQQPLARFACAWVDTFAPLPGWHPAEPKHYDPRNEPVVFENTWIGASYS
jgi:hypothetical protein